MLVSGHNISGKCIIPNELGWVPLCKVELHYAICSVQIIIICHIYMWHKHHREDS